MGSFLDDIAISAQNASQAAGPRDTSFSSTQGGGGYRGSIFNNLSFGSGSASGKLASAADTSTNSWWQWGIVAVVVILGLWLINRKR